MFLNRNKKKRQFAKLYDDYMGHIYRFLFLKVSSHDEAQDLTAKTFIKAWEAIQKMKSMDEIENPRAYIYRIARNLVIDYYRKNEKEKTITLSEDIVIEDEKISIEEKAKIDSEMEEVKEALQEINESYQDIIIWYYLDELTVSEISDLTDKSETTVRVTIHRAVTALRKQLKGDKGKRKEKQV